jgi:hypothetical protein
MANQFYWQQIYIADANYTAQNADVNEPNFVPFNCSEFAENSEGDDTSLTLVFAIGTFDQPTLERWISDAVRIVITCSSGDTIGAQIVGKWEYTGVITDAEVTLTTIALSIGSPLRPSTNNEAPGMVPPRSLMTNTAGRLPIARR